MKTVNIGELKNHLSAYLQTVRGGEEIVICDRNRPVARILPFTPEDDGLTAHQRMLVATGAMTLPKIKITDRKKFWEDFWATPAPSVPRETAIKAILDEREEGR